MRALVVLAVVGACSAMPFIPDAPDVAAEKARFFQAYQVAHAANLPRSSRPTQAAFVPHQAFNQAPVETPKWMGPLASNVPAGLPGSTAFVAETPEVQAAKNHFLNAYSAQVAATIPVGPSTSHRSFSAPSRPVFQAAAPAPRPQPKWTGPLASKVPAGLPGSSPVLSDTAEVAAAKNAFFHTYSAQVAATAGAPSTRFF